MELNKDYDSYFETTNHIDRVQDNLARVIFELAAAAVDHDKSKLESPEKELFDKWTPTLKKLTYGSEEYKAALAALGPALQHHYQNNSHHPEHFENGISGMTLIDVVEMLCDWKAATERHEDGDIRQSLTVSRQRFGISDQLFSILANTVEALGW